MAEKAEIRHFLWDFAAELLLESTFIKNQIYHLYQR